jgi:hypothetical protein
MIWIVHRTNWLPGGEHVGLRDLEWWQRKNGLDDAIARPYLLWSLPLVDPLFGG